MEMEANVSIIKWNEIEITVSIVLGWPVDNYCHIEIYCEERLPVTKTGYRSHFMVMETLEPYDRHVDFVTKWLNDAAQSTPWKQYLEEAKQLNLFDR